MDYTLVQIILRIKFISCTKGNKSKSFINIIGVVLETSLIIWIFLVQLKHTLIQKSVPFSKKPKDTLFYAIFFFS